MNGPMRGTPNSFGSASTTSSASVTVTGTVLNAATGLPVPRALVQLSGRSILTDHEGKFEFDQFTTASNAVLQVNKPGFYASPDADPMTNMVLRGDQLSAPIVVRLYAEGLLTGTLTATDGTPLSQVMVTAQRSVYNDTGHRWTPTGNSMTNSRGEFRLAVPPGDYRIETAFSPRLRGTSKAVLPLSIPASGSPGGSGVIHLSSGSEERFELHPAVGPAYAVGIHVEPTPDRGFPMMMARNSDGTTIPLAVARDGREGEMRVELPTGTYALIAELNTGDSMEYGESAVTIADHPVAGVVVRLTAVPSIPVELIQDAGTTSDKSPLTIPQLGLMIESTQEAPSRRGGSPMAPIISRERGTYFRAAPGTYRLTARNSGQWFVKSATYGTTDLLQQDMTIAPGAGSSAIVLTVSNQSGSLSGTASLNGSPSQVSIYLLPSGPSVSSVYSTRSGSDGSFNFSYLPPGSYQAIAFEARHSANYRDPTALADYGTYLHSVTINAGEKATLDLNAVPSTELVP
jgi:hypothetical protein